MQHSIIGRSLEMRTKERDVLYCGVREDVIKNAMPSLNWENVYHFKNFVIERYRVHKKKDVKRLQAPWTDNPVIREFKFTNVRREHDRQTRYLIENIVMNDEGEVILCREINHIK